MIGLEINNPQGKLIAHADGIGMTCLGKCTLSSVVQPTQNNNGYVIHTFNYTGVCGFVIDMPVGYTVAILGVSYNGSACTITSYCGFSDNGNGFQLQAAADVWAVAEITAANTPASSFGLALYNASGVRTFDFNSPGVSFVAAVGNFTGLGSGANLPALTRPVLMGVCEGYDVTYLEDPEAYPPYTKVDSMVCAVRYTASRVDTSFTQTYKSNAQLNGGTSSTQQPSGRFVIFEGASFP
jgi:hypothetical protein